MTLMFLQQVVMMVVVEEVVAGVGVEDFLTMTTAAAVADTDSEIMTTVVITRDHFAVEGEVAEEEEVEILKMVRPFCIYL